MAKSPAHKIGQLIGHMLEDIFEPLLREVALKTDTYLDKTNIERASRSGKTLTHIDTHGNNHGLDFVFERFGSDDKEGLPIGFIECAWRRYTKHSKNKVQEIHSAIESLASKYKAHDPFKGAILSGHYSEASIQQLKSQGYTVIHIPYETVIEAYEDAGYDISYNSKTNLEDLLYKGISIDGLSYTDINKIRNFIFKECSQSISEFINTLTTNLTKKISSIKVTPVVEQKYSFKNTEDTLKWLACCNSINHKLINLIDLEINYCNGGSIKYAHIKTSEAIKKISYHQRLTSSPIKANELLGDNLLEVIKKQIMQTKVSNELLTKRDIQLSLNL